MTEIEPTIENVRKGDTVTIEKGVPGEPGHALFTYLIASSPGRGLESHEVTVGYVQKITESDRRYRLTQIDRPAPPIPDEPVPTEPGERFWARWTWRKKKVTEFMVTDEQAIVNLDSGAQWDRDLFESNWTVVPAPEPETERGVRVAADWLIDHAGSDVENCEACLVYAEGGGSGHCPVHHGFAQGVDATLAAVRQKLGELE